jgi:Lhr-like helicase
MDVFDHYQTITHSEPYPHQVETYEALEAGQSIILRAPTGSGKSEVVFVPLSRSLSCSQCPSKQLGENFCLP